MTMVIVVPPGTNFVGPEEKMICTYAESALELGWALAFTL